MLAVENILLQKSNKNLAAVTSLSAHCSPVSNKRHKLNTSTASLASSCSSQVNNNYTTSLVDMDSLEDMLRKVCVFIFPSIALCNDIDICWSISDAMLASVDDASELNENHRMRASVCMCLCHQRDSDNFHFLCMWWQNGDWSKILQQMRDEWMWSGAQWTWQVVFTCDAPKFVCLSFLVTLACCHRML